MNSNFTFKQVDNPLTQDEQDAIVELWSNVTDTGGSVGFVAPIDEDDITEIRKLLAEYDASSAVSPLFLLLESENIVGLARLVNNQDALTGHWMTLKSLMVSPSLQGKGAGSYFMKRILEAARNLQLEFVTLSVRGEEGLEPFYEKHGFEVVAALPRNLKVSHDDYRDEVIMQKKL